MSSSDNLSIINPDSLDSSNVIYTPPLSISNMPFDEAIVFRYSDYDSLEAMAELKERVHLKREDINAYDEVFECLPPIPPIKEEEDDDSIDTLEACSRFERERDDAYDRAFQNKILKEYPELYKNIPTNSPIKSEKINVKMIKELCGGDKFYASKFYAVKDKIGDGKMEYIPKEIDRIMCTNAWKAITFSNNWDFVAEDIDSFAFSRDPRIDEITKKMEEFGYYGHSGMSFGCTMRNMQYLVKHGEEEFKKLFVLDKLESTV